MTAFEFEHPSGITVGERLTEAGLRNALPGLAPRDMHTGWLWYDLPPMESEGQRIAMSLAFFEGRLREITLYANDEALYGVGWTEWSAEKEALRVENTRRWLESQGYEIGHFPWGEIWAGYDARAGFGSARVRYKP